MLTHPLFDQLKTLRCEGMLEALQEQLNAPDINRLSFDERFALLIERECITRENRKLTNRLRQAKLKEEACLEDIDYPQKDSSLKQSSLDWQNVAGFPGKKIFLSQAPLVLEKHILLAPLQIKLAGKGMAHAILDYQNSFKR
jgi:hypothetical protein